MHNIKWIRDNPDIFDKAMKRRNIDAISQKILELDRQKRGEVSDLQVLQARSNELAKQIGALMAQGKKDAAQTVIAQSKDVKAQISALKDTPDNAQDIKPVLAVDPVVEILETLPNMLADDVPDGNDEADNHEISKWGKPKKFDFTPLPHYKIGENLNASTISNQMEFQQAVKISGSRFATLKGGLAKLERALSNFMLDIHTQEFGYEEVSPALLVRSEAMYGTGQLPKFEEDAFQTTDGRWLISTSEIVLANQVREMIIDSDKLPIRLTAYTPCFRSEAGSAGKDTRGFFRMHQFNKVEMVTITTAEESDKELGRKTACAQEVLKRLGLAHRVMLLCAGDTGFGARKTYDLEVWLPAQNTYREISSCSNCGDFQGRRMNARYRKNDDKETQFVHTLNGSGLAVGRTIVAILENYQNADGSVAIPDALVPYMGGQTVIDSVQR